MNGGGRVRDGEEEGSQNYLVIIRRISAGLKFLSARHIRQNVKDDNDDDFNDEA
jgi:hypothetical protein